MDCRNGRAGFFSCQDEKRLRTRHGTLAEIDRVYQGKIAEREIFLKQQLETLLAASNWEETDKVKKQLASEKARLEEEKNDAKERARRGFGSK